MLNAARDRHQHWEHTTEAMPSALLGELCQATAITPAARFSKRKMGWRAGATGYRLALRLSGARQAPAVANSGWCWRATPRSMAAILCRPTPASSSAQRIPPLPAPQVVSASNCCACNSAAARGLKKETINTPERPPRLIRSFGMEVTTRSRPGGYRPFRGSMAGLHTPLSTLHVRPHDRPAHHSGPM